MKFCISLVSILLFCQSSWGDAGRKTASEVAPFDRGSPPSYQSSNMGLVRHMVFFRYKASVTAEQKQEVIDNFLSLKYQCKRDGVPYIVSIDTGLHNSKEGTDQGMDQGFLVTFKSIKDRDYYVGQPFAGAPYPAEYEHAHDRFKKWLGDSGYLDDAKPNPVFVFDFTAE